MAGVNTTAAMSNIFSKTNSTDFRDYVQSAIIYRYMLLSWGGFVTFGLTIIGIPGNIVCCIVFKRQGLKDRMNLCLFSLAFVDLLLMSYALIWSSCVLFTFFGWFGFGDENYMIFLRINLGVSYGLRATSGFYALVISVERCVCVLFPLRVSHLVRTRTMAVILIFLAILPQLGFSLLPLKYQVGRIPTPLGLQWQLVPSVLWNEHKDLIDDILYMFMSVTVPLLTFISVSMATFITVIKLRAAASWREKVSSSADHGHLQQTGLTKMLVLTSCLYIVTMVPFVSLIITHLFIPEFSTNGRLVNIYMAYYTIVNCIPFINSAVVVVIYYHRSSRFRSEIHRLMSIDKA